MFPKKECQRNAKKRAQKVWSLLKVPIIVPKRVPFPQKSYQFSALKSAPKKFKKKSAKFSVLKSAQKSSSTLKSTKKGAQKSTFSPKKVLKIVL